MRRALLASLLLCAVPLTRAQGLDTPEPGSAEAIAAATTEPRFLSPWVASVPASDTVPSPTKFLGHIAGAPGELSNTTKIYGYYRALAAATPRVRVETIGKTEEGRDILLVIVGDEKDVANVDAVRKGMAGLADPRRCDQACADTTIGSIKPFYMLHGGLHSAETGSPEMLMELVYRIAVSNEPLIKGIRDNMTVLVNPVAEPDGRDKMVDWFYRHLKGKTDFDTLPRRSPPYWGKYVRHDNNRDGVQRKLALTRATQDAYLKWLPMVVHDLHESIALLSIWTGTGPYNVNLEPSVFSEWHTIAFHEVSTLTSFGMPGVWTYGFGEGWAHLYADSVAINHNGIGRGYETFGNATAETVERRLYADDEKYTGRPVTEADWYRVVPPPKKFKWSLRNNTNYQETAVLAALEYSARNAKDMLSQFYRRGASSVRRGDNEKPYAVAIPEDQPDRRRLARLVNLLREHGIEVSRASAAFKVKEGDYPAGTYLVKMSQPYRGWALDLLIPQKYPIDKAPWEAYDDVAWAISVSLGVDTKPIGDEAVKQVATTLVSEPVKYAGRVEGGGPVYLVKDAGQEALLAARVRLAKFAVEIAEKPFKAGDRDYPAGSWVIPGAAGLGPVLDQAAVELDLDVRSAAAAPDVPRHAADWPRLAVLQQWEDTQAPGWVRMIFDDQKIPYTLIMDDEVRKGGLRTRFDVILFPDTYNSLKDIAAGIDPKAGALAFTKTPEFAASGTPTTSNDITGGFTWTGIQNIAEFVKQGGTLITLGGASTLALDGGIGSDMQRASAKDVLNPGSELRVRFRRPEHPLAYGYPEKTSVFREERPLYKPERIEAGRIVLQWGSEIPKDELDEEPAADDDAPKPKKDPIVVSGGVKGGSEIEGKGAIFDIPVGKGRVLAYNFDPIHRYQTESDFRLVWNAILNWNDLPLTPPGR